MRIPKIVNRPLTSPVFGKICAILVTTASESDGVWFSDEDGVVVFGLFGGVESDGCVSLTT